VLLAQGSQGTFSLDKAQSSRPGVLSFLFFAKKKGPKKTRPQVPGGCAHSPRGLTV